MITFCHQQTLGAINHDEHNNKGNQLCTSMSSHDAPSTPTAAVGPAAAVVSSDRVKWTWVLNEFF